MSKFHIHSLSRRTYSHTVLWSIFLCLLIVVVAAALGRAANNFRAALTDKPDVAIYILLKDKELGNTTLLREGVNERDYLAETASGPILVRLKKGEEEWFVSFTEPLHDGTGTGARVMETESQQ